MDNKKLAIILSTAIIIIGILAYTSMQNTKTKADATVTKYQEQTKRADGRHQLLDFLGLIRRDK